MLTQKNKIALYFFFGLLFLILPDESLAVKNPQPKQELVKQHTKKQTTKTKGKKKKPGFFKRLLGKWKAKKKAKKARKLKQQKRQDPESKYKSKWSYYSKKIFLGALIVFLISLPLFAIGLANPHTFAGMIGASDVNIILYIGSLFIGILAIISIVIHDIVRLFQ